MKIDISIGDIIETKKAHPCGSKTWKIIRTGADVKLKCEICGRIIMMGYDDFTKRYRKTVSKNQVIVPAIDQAEGCK